MISEITFSIKLYGQKLLRMCFPLQLSPVDINDASPVSVPVKGRKATPSAPTHISIRHHFRGT